MSSILKPPLGMGNHMDTTTDLKKKRLDRAIYCSREKKTEARVFQLAPPCWDHFSDKAKYRPWVRAERSAVLLAATNAKNADWRMVHA